MMDKTAYKMFGKFYNELNATQRAEIDAKIAKQNRESELQAIAMRYVVRGLEVPLSIRQELLSIDTLQTQIPSWNYQVPVGQSKTHDLHTSDFDNCDCVEIGVKAEFDGSNNLVFLNQPRLKRKSFTIVSHLTVKKVKNDNYFLGDNGSSKNYVFQIGWKDKNTFRVDFGQNFFDVKVPQELKSYDIAFSFDYASKIGTLTIGDETFTHDFKTYYKDKFEYIGRGNDGYFVGTIKKLEIYSS